jgi:RNA polymerase sigma-70 factor (ECF subfamily)
MADMQQHANTDASATTLPPFEVLFERYEKGIFNLIYRMVGDMEDATDLTSQTFLHALRAYDRFRGEAQAYTWLYRIAVNLCKNHFRKRDREARFQLVSLDAPVMSDGEEMERDIEDLTQSPERLMEGQELQVRIQEAIAALAPDLRTVILLRDVQGLSYQEVADITGCTVEAVKSRIFRARGHLRRALGPYLHPEPATDTETSLPDPPPTKRRPS